MKRYEMADRHKDYPDWGSDMFETLLVMAFIIGGLVTVLKEKKTCKNINYSSESL
ncbi:hypothetical protein PSSHI_07140 [Photobacterium sp. R1]